MSRIPVLLRCFILPLLSLLGASIDGNAVEGGAAPPATSPTTHKRCQVGVEMKQTELKQKQDFVAERQAQGQYVDPVVNVQIRALQQEIAAIAQHPQVVQCEAEEARLDAEMAALSKELSEAQPAMRKHPDCYLALDAAVTQLRDLMTERRTEYTAMRLRSARAELARAQEYAKTCEVQEDARDKENPAEDAAEGAAAKRKAAANTTTVTTTTSSKRRTYRTTLACLESSGFTMTSERMTARDGAVEMVSFGIAKVSMLMRMDKRDTVTGAVVLVQDGGDVEKAARIYFALGNCVTGTDKKQVAQALLTPLLARVGGAYFRSVKTNGLAKFAVAWSEGDVRELAK